VVSKPQQYALNSFLDGHYTKKTKSYHFSIGYLTCKQCSKIKSLIVNTNNWLNENFPFFNRLNKEPFLGFWLVDNFSDQFFFHIVNYKDTEAKNTHWNNLNKIFDEFLSNSKLFLSFLMLVLCQAWFTLGWKSAEWTRRWVDLWNDLGFSLCAAPSVCRVVTTLDEEKRVRC